MELSEPVQTYNGIALNLLVVLNVQNISVVKSPTVDKNPFTKKLRANCSQGMPAVIRCRICCLTVLPFKNLKIKIYGTTMLPAVWYGCETWSLTLREELRLMVFENRVLRRIFGLKKDEVRGVWRKLHDEELNDLYCSPNRVQVIKSRRMKWWGM
jgi:hypothetical protein